MKSNTIYAPIGLALLVYCLIQVEANTSQEWEQLLANGRLQKVLEVLDAKLKPVKVRPGANYAYLGFEESIAYVLKGSGRKGGRNGAGRFEELFQTHIMQPCQEAKQLNYGNLSGQDQEIVSGTRRYSSMQLYEFCETLLGGFPKSEIAKAFKKMP